jgi:hypothetical protein
MGGLHRNAFDSAQLAERRVVDQHVDAPSGRYNVAYRALNAFFICHVQFYWLDAIGSNLFQPVQAARHGEYVIAILRKKFSCGPSNATGRARYQRSSLSHILRSFYIAIRSAFYP